MIFSGMIGFKVFNGHATFLRKLAEEVFPPKRKQEGGKLGFRETMDLAQDDEGS